MSRVLRPLSPVEAGDVAERARRLFLDRVVELEAERLVRAYLAETDAPRHTSSTPIRDVAARALRTRGGGT